MSIKFELSPKDLISSINVCLKSGVVPFIQSSPGLGKSSIVKSIAEDKQLELIDLRLSMCDPCDLQGLPRFINNRAEFVPFDIFPVEDTPIPKGKNGWILFLDEFNSAPKAVQAAAYKIVLDRMIGNHKLHNSCAVICAGNNATDRAITTELSTAMKSRLIHLHLKIDVNEWIEYALKNDFDPRVISYIKMNGENLNNFNPENQLEDTFSSPRTWEFASKILKTIYSKTNSFDVPNEYRPLLVGTLGESVGCSFMGYLEVYNRIPTFEEIMRDPQNTKIPHEKELLYALVIGLVPRTNVDNLGTLFNYIDRIEDRSICIMYLKYITNANKGIELLASPDYQKIVTKFNSIVGKDNE